MMKKWSSKLRVAESIAAAKAQAQIAVSNASNAATAAAAAASAVATDMSSRTQRRSQSSFLNAIRNEEGGFVDSSVVSSSATPENAPPFCDSTTMKRKPPLQQKESSVSLTVGAVDAGAVDADAESGTVMLSNLAPETDSREVAESTLDDPNIAIKAATAERILRKEFFMALQRDDSTRAYDLYTMTLQRFYTSPLPSQYEMEWKGDNTCDGIVSRHSHQDSAVIGKDSLGIDVGSGGEVIKGKLRELEISSKQKIAAMERSVDKLLGSVKATLRTAEILQQPNNEASRFNNSERTEENAKANDVDTKPKHWISTEMGQRTVNVFEEEDLPNADHRDKVITAKNSCRGVSSRERQDRPPLANAVINANQCCTEEELDFGLLEQRMSPTEYFPISFYDDILTPNSKATAVSTTLSSKTGLPSIFQSRGGGWEFYDEKRFWQWNFRWSGQLVGAISK
ncbi:MAG: hypothetical protein ACREBR_02380 [bacterium]